MADVSQPGGIIVGRITTIIPSKSTSVDITIYPFEAKPKTAGIYTDIPEASPLWEQIGDRRTKWRFQKAIEGWDKSNDILTLWATPALTSEIITAAEQESIAAVKRSITLVKPGVKHVNGQISVVLRGLERLVQAKGKNLFMQLCIDGRMVSTSNNLTSPLVWSSDNLPDGCYLVEIRAYTDGMNRLLFTSSQTICVRNEL
ncbi:MAG: hypothetical protein ACYC1M_02710 [Armatimonadota bacterium]